MFPFYISWKNNKTKGFFVFFGSIKGEHWLEMGSVTEISNTLFFAALVEWLWTTLFK